MIEKIIGLFLKETGEKIENNECGLSSEELYELSLNVMHIKLNKTEAADLLNMSTRSFDRKISSGEFPEGRKIRGSNNLFWYKDELLNKLEK